MPTAAPPTGLVRSLRRLDLVGIVLNGVIGAGIFGLPAKVFSLAGDYSLAAFVLCALCASVIVISFAEVASRYSGTGGPYLYALDTFGPITGFTVGWLVWMARITSFGANCSLLPEYLDVLFPGAASGLPRAAIITTVIALITVINLRGVRLMADASNILAIGKLLPLLVFVAVGLFFLDPARFSFASVPSYGSFSKAVLLSVYAFTGFEMALIPGGETRDPKKNLPAALLMGMVTVVIFYVLIQVVCIGTLPELASSTRPLSDAVRRFLGTGGAVMITLGIVISLAGNLNVLVLAASRITFAMAERAQLPRAFATVLPGPRTPVVSIVAATSIMLAFTLSGTFIYLLTLSTISRLIAYLITCAALPVLRHRATAPAATFSVPAGSAVAAVGVAAVIWLLTNLTLREARDAAVTVVFGWCLLWLTKKGAFGHQSKGP